MDEGRSEKRRHTGGQRATLIALVTLLLIVLVRALWLFVFLPIGYQVSPPAATATSPCPTTDTITGSDSYETAPVKSSAAALTSANNLLQSRADVEAGLAKNGYSCPNPACQDKQLGGVVATPDPGYPYASRANLFAILSTVFDLFTNVYWSGNMSYTWSATITCR